MTSMKIESDLEKRRRLKAEARRKLEFLITCGNERDIVAYTKAWNPEITEEQLKRVIKLFHDAKRGRGRSPQSR